MHAAVIRVASDPRAPALSPNVEPGQIAPVDRVVRKDGTQHVYHFTQFLAQAASDPVMVDELRRVWLVGALLAVVTPLGTTALNDADILIVPRNLNYYGICAMAWRTGIPLKFMIRRI